MVTRPRQNLEDYAVILSDKDNVATALVDLPAGDYMLGSGSDQPAITVPEDIKGGFKLALSDIDKGGPIYKYGYLIGLATEDIAKGNCVHVHNLISSV
ncbi:MAG: UxaA family hydrolase [Phycisphaerae bacterium]|nr:UxaA family hydrolase [Phycisphaerae bacterium]